jgi:hypothetical protein
MPSDGRYTDPYAASNTRQYYQHDSYDYDDPTRSRGGYSNQPQDGYDPYNSSANQEAMSNHGQHRRNLSRSQSQRVRYTDEAPGQEAGANTLKRTGGSTRTRKSESLSVTPVRKEFNGFEAGEFTPVVKR